MIRIACVEVDLEQLLELEPTIPGIEPGSTAQQASTLTAPPPLLVNAVAQRLACWLATQLTRVSTPGNSDNVGG